MTPGSDRRSRRASESLPGLRGNRLAARWCQRARRSSHIAIAVLALGGTALPARAAGPLLVNGAGIPLTWAAPIPFNPDRGTLGALSNADAVALVADSFGAWAAVPTAALSFVNAGPLPVDVTASNVFDYLGACDGWNPVIFDTDGSIVRTVFGAGAENTILGFADIECGAFDPPEITEAIAVLNGRFIDGVSSSDNPEIPVSPDFEAVFRHEFGHYINLDHTQVNRSEAFDGNPANDAGVPTMFPILVNGAEQHSLHRDDEVSVSTLYPAPSFFSTGEIRGSILLSDGTTPFQGANVIARNTANPLLDAVSNVSGALFFPGNPGGPPPSGLEGAYRIPGLTPGAAYTVEVEEIDPSFTDGSTVGPLDPPAPLPGPPEFWNGASEAGSNPPDDPADATPVVVTPGVPETGVDIVLNSAPPPANDECTTATAIASTPFADVVETSGATTGAGDSAQTCGRPVNGHSVWYSFTAPADGIVTADTFGSDYDTVLSGLTGGCGGLVEVACSDDTSGLQSRVSMSVAAGTAILFQIASYDGTSGGTLHFQVQFTAVPSPPACPPAPTAGCLRPGRSLLVVRDRSVSGSDPDLRDALVWKWLRGPAISFADLGDPAAGLTSYSLCVYDEAGGIPALVAAAGAQGGGICPNDRPCWKRLGTASAPKGYRYLDRELTPDGLLRVQLNKGDTDGESKVLVIGRGANLPLPGPTGTAYFAQDSAVTVQLIRSDGGLCWEARYVSPAHRNRTDLFRDSCGGLQDTPCF